MYRLALIVALATLALWPHSTTASSSSDFKIDVEYSQDRMMRVRCDGDSIPITVRVTRISDGSPVAGADVSIYTNDPPTVTTTNKHGVAHAAIIPQIQASVHRYFVVSVTLGAEGISWGPGDYSCPFPSGEFGLNVRMFIDKSGDGTVEKHEPAFANRDVQLRFVGDTRSSTLIDRLYRLDEGGGISTTPYRAGYARNEPGLPNFGWEICLTGRDVTQGWEIVSASPGVTIFGAEGTPTVCARIPILNPGANDFTIGVRRIR